MGLELHCVRIELQVSPHMSMRVHSVYKCMQSCWTNSHRQFNNIPYPLQDSMNKATVLSDQSVCRFTTFLCMWFTCIASNFFEFKAESDAFN